MDTGSTRSERNISMEEPEIRDENEDSIWRYIMFNYRDELVKKAQYDDKLLEAEKERLIKRIEAEQQEQEAERHPLRRKENKPGLIGRLIQAILGRKADRPSQASRSAEGTGKYVSE